ncbi:hypothetical protein TRAPUB_12446 [Trametes pubescens]|uniref:AB hydrolase-1 domain-containing protein n=1 Tax=Trametes pubescens TaxID=154538 RepID=A0A1M2VTV9_TRAPU|nr:hypothetical protein TRAPUB_12446 [Trametes pubescens]
MGDTSFLTKGLFIAQLKGLLDRLGIRHDFDLLGHSWGGILDARFAAGHPPGLKNFILSDLPASTAL